jgi:AraC-like DNA-binding protein
MPSRSPAPFPVYKTSGFAARGEQRFAFDIVRLEDRPDIPRRFAHRHDYHHLLWLSEAAGTHLLDFQRHEARANTVFFIAPGQLHAWESAILPRGFVVNFSTDFLSGAPAPAGDAARVPFFDRAPDPPLLRMTQAQHDALHPLLLEIEREFLARAPGSLEVVRAYLLILLTRLARLHPAAPGATTLPAGFAEVHQRFRTLLDARFLDFAHLSDYAQALGVTERQLRQAVRRTTGKTAGQAIQERVALEARRLLGHSTLGVSEIAFRLRFEDHAYFSRFFRKHTGMSPREFRSRHAAPPGTG